MSFLVAYSVLSPNGSYVASMIIRTSLLSIAEVKRRHIENWETIRIPDSYDNSPGYHFKVISFQEVGEN